MSYRKFTVREDKLILAGRASDPPKSFARIGADIGRCRASVFSRWKVLNKENRQPKRYVRKKWPAQLRGGCSYKTALPPSEWTKAELFLGMMLKAKQTAIRTGERPTVDMDALKAAFQSV